jgi:hypothetical protein
VSKKRSGNPKINFHVVFPDSIASKWLVYRGSDLLYELCGKLSVLLEDIPVH